MTQKEMIETIQQDFPDIGETQIRLMLNRALDKFDGEVELERGTATVSVTVDDRVDYNNKQIKRFTGVIEETDIS